MSILGNYSIAFPARDTFYHGLSRDFYDEFSEFRNAFNEASDFLNEDLYKVAYENPKIKPELHTVCLITHCMALYKVLLLYIEKPHAAIGFSQGEFAAVSATGSIPFPEILKLVYELELLLINNATISNGSMVRVMELDRKILRECCNSIDSNEDSIAVAITYSNDQNVVSGRSDKIKELSKLAKEKGARWVIPLDGGGAFHSPLCRDILHTSKHVFDNYKFLNADFAVFSCVDGKMSMDGKNIKEKLSQQIAMPILWDTLIRNQKDYGNNCILELGPGCTISGNTRIIDDTITCKWINSMNDFKNIIK
jgi:[acyl-carrier-protein] S-malonyltransferase